MIIDGRAIAKEVLARARARAELLVRTPSFAAIVVAPTPATRSYLAIKSRQASVAGITMNVHELSETITTDELVTKLGLIQEDALIVQLPLPDHIDTEQVLAAIPIEKDADVLSVRARTEGTLMHPIAASVQDILVRAQVSVTGSKAAVVGQGWLVGKPVAAWLQKAGANVSVLTLETGMSEEVLTAADIIVSGAGDPGIITLELVRTGAAVIDVGTSELGGSLAGDVAPEVAEKAGVFTPVPGGVGPVAVAYLMENVVTLAEGTLLTNALPRVH